MRTIQVEKKKTRQREFSTRLYQSDINRHLERKEMKSGLHRREKGSLVVRNLVCDTARVNQTTGALVGRDSTLGERGR